MLGAISLRGLGVLVLGLMLQVLGLARNFSMESIIEKHQREKREGWQGWESGLFCLCILAWRWLPL